LPQWGEAELGWQYGQQQQRGTAVTAVEDGFPRGGGTLAGQAELQLRTPFLVYKGQKREKKVPFPPNDPKSICPFPLQY
jgi:hypothetical protein